MFASTDDVVDGVPVLALHGEIDVSDTPRLAEAVTRLVARADHVAAVLDLTGVTFFDSSGLKALDDARLAAEDQAVRLEIVCPPGKVLRLLEMTGIDDQFRLHPDVASAVRALRG